MQPTPENAKGQAPLDEHDLAGLATALSDLYDILYGERPRNAYASLSGNLLAWVFEGGLTPADEQLIWGGDEASLHQFRRNFFEVAGEELEGVVRDLSHLPVSHSFFGFDPPSQTTHTIFVLGGSGPHPGRERF